MTLTWVVLSEVDEVVQPEHAHPTEVGGGVVALEAEAHPLGGHALRQRHARELEELKREHNELLLGALRTHNARALTTATKAVRRELCLLVHPDKASRFASARLMGEAVMQRLGELAQ